jgi:prevent-host-death family protein
MGTAISAAEANRQFSAVLRHVRDGRTFVVTSHGRPVARIVPVDARNEVASTARASLIERLRKARVSNVGRWTRDELYEDEA